MEPINLTPLVNAIIALLAALVTSRVIPWLNAKLDAEKQASLRKWAGIAVSAAEQLFNSDEASAKKVYVKEFLADHGFSLDESETDAVIEAAVLTLHSALQSRE